MFPTKAAAALLASASLIACSPANHYVIMQALGAKFARPNYECLPLGWVPVPVHGTYYYEGYSAEAYLEDWWLKPYWTAIVNTSELKHADVRVTYELLNRLVRVGMLERKRLQGAFQYHLTMRALPYYFDQNDFGNNPEGYSYLCYSGIVPQRVIWSQPLHIEQNIRDSEKNQVFRAAFEWLPGPVASWADDPFLRSHSLILVPTRDPIVIKFVNHNDIWEIDNASIYAAGLPHVRFVDASVWPSG